MKLTKDLGVKNMSKETDDLSVGKRALRGVKAEWMFQFICWSLIWIGIAAMVIYAVETGRIQRIDTDSSSPVFDAGGGA